MRAPMSAASGVVLMPAIIGAVLCVGIPRSGLFSFLFLIPLGIVAYWYNRKTVWISAGLAVIGNMLFSLGILMVVRPMPVGIGWDIVYFVVMLTAFTWVVAPPGDHPPRGLYRLIAASVLGALASIPILRILLTNEGLFDSLKAQVDALISLQTASLSADVVRQSLAEQYITADLIIRMMETVALRGGVIAVTILFFFLSSQIARGITRLFRHEWPTGALRDFHVAAKTLWVLSCSILGVLLGLFLSLPTLEITAWNILAVCIMLYAAQGWGILLFFLTKPNISSGLRFFLNLLLLMMLMSPGINAVVLGMLILLGVAEHWLSFRTPKTDGPSSTPLM